MTTVTLQPDYTTVRPASVARAGQAREVLRIVGGVPLMGCVNVSGAKNAALPIMAACLLTDASVELERVPKLTDVATMSHLLLELGMNVERHCDHRLRITQHDATRTSASARWVGQMRASFCVLGPLLARRGQATVALPGGCAIGERPIDLHLCGLAALGADVRLTGGYCHASARRLRGATIDLNGPHGPTVTGTANVLCAATLARGRTVIVGAAREPEIVDLGMFLNTLGARITGLGSSILEIEGVEVDGLRPPPDMRYAIIPDRIEAATLALAAVITRGDVTIRGSVPEHLQAVLETLDDFGAHVTIAGQSLRVVAHDRPRPVTIVAQPYPGLPTDVQAQVVAVAALAAGRSTVRDTVFGERFAHVAQLARLGARVQRAGDCVTLEGVARLQGTTMIASDLRASAALVLAGLAAEGISVVRELHHLDRGYDGLAAKLRSLGGRVERVVNGSTATIGR